MCYYFGFVCIILLLTFDEMFDAESVTPMLVICLTEAPFEREILCWIMYTFM